MTTWLTGFIVEIKGVEMFVYHLIAAESQEKADAGATAMGRTWWADLQEEEGGHRWRYPQGQIWLNSVIPLRDVDNTILRGLKLLDAWTVTGAPDAPELRDEWGNDWRDITR